MNMLLLLKLFFCFICCTKAGSFIDINDPDLLEVQADIYEWWGKNTRALMRCSDQDHATVSSTIERRNLEDEKTLQISLHNSMLANDNKGYFGLHECLVALRTKRTQVILLQKGKYISVLDYRDPATGHHVYKYIEESATFAPREISNAKGNRRYFLHKCLTFPTFIKRSYGRKAPPIVIVDNPTHFFPAIGGVGGFFEDDFLLSAAPSKKEGEIDEKRKYQFFYRHEVNLE